MCDYLWFRQREPSRIFRENDRCNDILGTTQSAEKKRLLVLKSAYNKKKIASLNIKKRQWRRMMTILNRNCILLAKFRRPILVLKKLSSWTKLLPDWVASPEANVTSRISNSNGAATIVVYPSTLYVLKSKHVWIWVLKI